jgi:hypothetical protein
MPASCIAKLPLNERFSLLRERAAGKTKGEFLDVSKRSGQSELDKVIESILSDVASQQDARTLADDERIMLVEWLRRHATGECNSGGGMFQFHNLTTGFELAKRVNVPGPYVYAFGPVGASIIKNGSVEGHYDSSGVCSPLPLKYGRGTLLIGKEGNVFLYDGNAWRTFDGKAWATIGMTSVVQF